MSASYGSQKQRKIKKSIIIGLHITTILSLIIFTCFTHGVTLPFISPFINKLLATPIVQQILSSPLVAPITSTIHTLFTSLSLKLALTISIVTPCVPATIISPIIKIHSFIRGKLENKIKHKYVVVPPIATCTVGSPEPPPTPPSTPATPLVSKTSYFFQFPCCGRRKKPIPAPNYGTPETLKASSLASSTRPNR